MNDLHVIENELTITSNLHNDIKKQIHIISKMVDAIRVCYKSKHKVLLFGNGGSAADAQHVAAEFMGRFKKNRKPLAALALTTDTSFITAVGNDFGFEYIFSRQCEALVETGDIVIVFSTSGTSKNVINGVITAKKKGGIILGFTGDDGGDLKKHCTYIIRVPTNDTPKTQEIHRTIAHIICGLVEK
jgi:D-sedoheptulose 7-phosphate isomerase